MNREPLTTLRDEFITFRESLRNQKDAHDIYVRFGFREEQHFNKLIAQFNTIIGTIDEDQDPRQPTQYSS